MQARILTTAYALLLGAWYYSEQKQGDLYSQGVYDFLHSTGFGIAFVVAGLLVGFAVGRWWVVAALLGPLLTLGYLQVTGYVSPWHDGASPLSIPTIAQMFWSALFLVMGVGLRRLWVSRIASDGGEPSG